MALMKGIELDIDVAIDCGLFRHMTDDEISKVKQDSDVYTVKFFYDELVSKTDSMMKYGVFYLASRKNYCVFLSWFKNSKFDVLLKFEWCIGDNLDAHEVEINEKWKGLLNTYTPPIDAKFSELYTKALDERWSLE